MPRVSPNKTWSGAVGGTLASMLGGVLVAHYYGVTNLAATAGVAMVLSLVSQAGDLFESAIKRHFHTKDASHLIPGHGGLMDRLDGFVTAALAAALHRPFPSDRTPEGAYMRIARAVAQDHPEHLFPLPIMVCATSVDNQVTVPGTAIRIRINLPCLQLAVVTTSPATTMLSLMVVLMPTTLISTKLKTSLLL